MKKSATPHLAGYETVYVTKTEITESTAKEIQDKVLSAIARHQGEVCVQEDWGRRRLAYTIRRETRGHYLYLLYTGDSGAVEEVERNLRLNHDQVLRFLTVKLGDEFNFSEYDKKRFSLLKKAEEMAREPRMERGRESRDYREARE